MNAQAMAASGEIEPIRAAAHAAYVAGDHVAALQGFAHLRRSGMAGATDVSHEVACLIRLGRLKELLQLATDDFDLLATAPNGLLRAAQAMRGGVEEDALLAFLRRAASAQPRRLELRRLLVSALAADGAAAEATALVDEAASWAGPTAVLQLLAHLASGQGDHAAAAHAAAATFHALRQANDDETAAARTLAPVIVALTQAARDFVSAGSSEAAVALLAPLRGSLPYAAQHLLLDLQSLARLSRAVEFRAVLAQHRALAAGNADVARRIAAMGRTLLPAAPRQDLLQDALRNAPQDLGLTEALVRTMLEADDAEGARAVLARLPAGLRDDERMWALSAAVAEGSAEYAGAAAIYGELVARHPEVEAWSIARFHARVKAGEADQAERELASWIAAAGAASAARRELMNHFGQARRYFEAAALIEEDRADHELPGTLLGWALTLFRVGLFERGFRLLEKLETRHGRTPALLGVLITSLEEQGDAERAFEIASARHAEAGEPVFLRMMCDLATRLRRFADAERLLDELARTAEAANVPALRLRLSRTRAQHAAWMAEVATNADVRGITPGDEMLRGDYFASFGLTGAAEDAYLRAAGAADPAFRHLVQARLISLYAEAGRIESVIEATEALPLPDLATPTLFLLERAVMRKTSDRRVAALSARIHREIADRRAASPIRRIAIVGGSNTVMTVGWGKSLEALAQRVLGVPVHNLALGASSSLYCWLRIVQDDLFRRYDLVLFEHALNDAVYVNDGSMDQAFRRDILQAIARRGAETGGRFGVLLTFPRDNAEAALAGTDPTVEETRRFCAAGGVATDDVPGRLRSFGLSPGFTRFYFRDDLHFTAAASTDMAANILASVTADAGFGRLDRVPDAWRGASGGIGDVRIAAITASQVSGDFEVREYRSPFYSGHFLRLARGASVEVTLTGRLAGLLVNIGVDTGFVRITIGERSMVKNLFGFRNTTDPAKPRIMLRQFHEEIRLEQPTRVRIALDVSASDLKTLPHDWTPYSSAPDVPLQEGVIEIAGFVVC